MIIFQDFQNGDCEFGLYFCSSSFAFCFVRRRVKNLNFLYIFLDILVGLTLLHLNKKYRKRADIFWVKTWMFSHKTQNFLTNDNGNLQNRCHSKIVLGHAVLQLFSESTFSVKKNVFLNNFIS